MLHLERHFNKETKTIYRTATVLKDRSTKIDGKIFRNATFLDLKPHVDYLNLGGVHCGVDTNRSSEAIVSPDSKSDWQKDKEQAEIVLDEIKALLTKHVPGRSDEAQNKKGDLLEIHFGSRSWKRIETYDLQQLRDGYKNLMNELEKQ